MRNDGTDRSDPYRGEHHKGQHRTARADVHGAVRLRRARKRYQGGSVTRAEWSAAGEQGLKPEYQVDVFAGDYQGEKIVRMEVNGTEQTFAVYRTYRSGDTVELYLEWKTGDSSYEEPEPKEAEEK